MASRAKVPRWTGPRAADIIEQPDSPHIHFEPERTVIEQTLRGAYLRVRKVAPLLGEVIRTTEGDAVVEDVDLRRQRPNIGLLSVKSSIERSNCTIGEEDKPGMPELEWVQVEVPMTSHPNFDPFAKKAGKYKLTALDLVQLQLWRAEEDPTLKATFVFSPGGRSDDHVTLSANAQRLAKKALRGQDTVLMHYPVVRLSTQTLKPPIDGAPAVIWKGAQLQKYLRGAVNATGGSKAIGATASGSKLKTKVQLKDIPAGYEWLQTASRAARTDKRYYTRFEEWTGALEWDRDFYEEKT